MVKHEPDRQKASKPRHNLCGSIALHLRRKHECVVKAKRHQERKQRERHKHIALVDINRKRSRHVQENHKNLHAERDAQDESAHVTARVNHAEQEPNRCQKQNHGKRRVERIFHDTAKSRIRLEVHHDFDVRLEVEPQVFQRVRRMRTTLEIIPTISRHRIDRRPAHCNHRRHKGWQTVRLFEEVTVIVKRKRDKCKYSFLAGLRKESKQRNRQEEMLPRDLVRRHKRVPRHQHSKQENVEDFGRCRARLQQVYRHAAQERRRRKRKLIALEPLAKRKEERNQAQDVERIVHHQRRIAIRFHKVEHKRIDKA